MDSRRRSGSKAIAKETNVVRRARGGSRVYGEGGIHRQRRARLALDGPTQQATAKGMVVWRMLDRLPRPHPKKETGGR